MSSQACSSRFFEFWSIIGNQGLKQSKFTKGVSGVLGSTAMNDVKREESPILERERLLLNYVNIHFKFNITVGAGQVNNFPLGSFVGSIVEPLNQLPGGQSMNIINK